MTISEIGLQVNKEKLSVTIIQPEKNPLHLVLFLFGGSKSRGKERFAEWQKTLAQKNISSVSFDYSGTGKSTGDFFASSLAKRIIETAAIIRWIKKGFGSEIQITLCGGSMGAYIALGVSRIFPKSIKNLILFCPAAYAKESNSVCFGPEFTACIRKPKSWKNSLSFGWIEKFLGRILLLVPEKDEVIPAGIPLEHLLRARNASGVKYITIPAATHNLLDIKTANSQIRRLMYKYSIEFLKENL